MPSNNCEVVKRHVVAFCDAKTVRVISFKEDVERVIENMKLRLRLSLLGIERTVNMQHRHKEIFISYIFVEKIEVACMHHNVTARNELEI